MTTVSTKRAVTAELVPGSHGPETTGADEDTTVTWLTNV
jgi:hypothetical protein